MPCVPQALLFDVGGVLIDVDFARVLSAWAPLSALPPDELRRRFAADEPYRRHERGELVSEAYFAHLADTLQLAATPAQVEAGWNTIFGPEIVATRRLLQQASRRLPCHLFSNTNASHAREWLRRYPELVASVERIFLSHEMGLRKPEPAAFAYVCDSLGLAPQGVLFFDDLAENVAAAREAGLQAVVAGSPGDVEAALLAARLI
ncbi:HAD-IA family hydrolase [Rubrivivax gelatinosus]|uniref:Putative hydrolase of the HAD superfamily n=1 Tax=Rubrivivax gelatinosus TaxID=28068 RepID=A0A4R2LVK3_RUBGE|nr:HAD-IA family hydrolase [Rubrivivax gelatinosus]TCO97660.1 putative hydrolase of the HAD superfamily [Rubrivivax gelatinosus]